MDHVITENTNEQEQPPSSSVAASTPTPVRVIEARSTWSFLDFAELWRSRELLFIMVWNGVRLRHVQSVLGSGWIAIQPLFTMVVMTLFFGKLARLNSDGVPYALFNFAALVPWFYFSGALSGTSNGLNKHAGVLGKVYFPRFIALLEPLLGKIVDFLVSLIVLLGLMALYGFFPTINALFIPWLVLIMVLTALGVGMVLAPLAAQYNDVNYAIGFVTQLLLYATPVIYSVSVIPPSFRLLYGIYPMVGVIEGFRSALLGTVPMPWDLLIVGSISSVLVFIVGGFVFARMEQILDDVV